MPYVIMPLTKRGEFRKVGFKWDEDLKLDLLPTEVNVSNSVRERANNENGGVQILDKHTVHPHDTLPCGLAQSTGQGESHLARKRSQDNDQATKSRKERHKCTRKANEESNQKITGAADPKAKVLFPAKLQLLLCLACSPLCRRLISSFGILGMISRGGGHHLHEVHEGRERGMLMHPERRGKCCFAAQCVFKASKLHCHETDFDVGMNCSASLE